MTTMAEDDGPVFRLSDGPDDGIATLLIVALHRLANRASLTSLEAVLKRLALRPPEKAWVVLEVDPICPKTLVKAATRLCSHVVLHRDSVFRPLNAVAHALAGVAIRAMDTIAVFETTVLPDEDFIDRVVTAAARSEVDMHTLAPASHKAFAVRAGVLRNFCSASPVLARAPDADILLACWVGRGQTPRGPRDLRGRDTDFPTKPVGATVAPRVTPDDVALLKRVFLRLGLHNTDPKQLPILEEAAAAARVRLRRACAAHYREESDVHEAVTDILYAPHTGIVRFISTLGSSSAPAVIPGMFIEMGTRIFIEDLGMHSHADVEFRKKMMEAFPVVRDRLKELDRRLVRSIANTSLLRDGDNALSSSSW